MRSGSTLLRLLLECHPAVACPPESKIIAALYDAVRAPEVLPAVAALGFGPDEVLGRLGAVVAGLLQDYAEAHGKRRWIDKTPEYSRIVPFVDALFRRRAKYVVIVRHPLDCVCSLEEFDKRWPQFHRNNRDVQPICEVLGRSRLAWARYWTETYRDINEWRETVADRCMTVKYEDLVVSPSAVVENVIEFIGEDPRLVDIQAALVGNTMTGYQDHKILQTREIHRNSVERWRILPRDEVVELWAAVEGVAQYYGYASDS
jgi:hypothetical protein